MLLLIRLRTPSCRHSVNRRILSTTRLFRHRRLPLLCCCEEAFRRRLTTKPKSLKLPLNDEQQILQICIIFATGRGRKSTRGGAAAEEEPHAQFCLTCCEGDSRRTRGITHFRGHAIHRVQFVSINRHHPPETRDSWGGSAEVQQGMKINILIIKICILSVTVSREIR